LCEEDLKGIVSDVLAEFGITAGVIEAVRRDWADTTGTPRWFRVESDCGRLFLKSHPLDSPKTRSVPELVAHLARNGFTDTPKLLAARSGQQLIERGGALWSLSEWLDLQPYLENASDADWTATASLLGRMHTASRGFRRWDHVYSYNEWITYCESPLKVFESFERGKFPGSEDDELHRAVLGILPDLRGEAERVLKAAANRAWYEEINRTVSSQQGFVHSDIGPANLMRCGTRLMIIDWDSWSQSLRWDNDLTFLVAHCPEDLVEKVIRAYEAECPILAQEAWFAPLLLSAPLELKWILDEEMPVRARLHYLRHMGLLDSGTFIRANRARWDRIAWSISQ